MKNQENKKTWLNRLENYMSTFRFEFDTKDLHYHGVIEKKRLNSSGIDQECFVPSIYVYKNCSNQMLIRQSNNVLKTVDEAINEINQFVIDNFWKNL